MLRRRFPSKRPDVDSSNFYDWVPLHLREGAWSQVGVLSFGAVAAVLMYWMPDATVVALPCEAYLSRYHVLNVFLFLWCNFVIVILMARVTVIKLPNSMTGWSWLLLTVRSGSGAHRKEAPPAHSLLLTAAPAGSARPLPTFETASSSGPGCPGAAAIRPLLRADGAASLLLGELEAHIRFPVMGAAISVFLLWNFVMMPVIYARLTPTRRREFINYSVQFGMLNVHVFNLPMAIAQTTLGGDAALLKPFGVWLLSVIILVYLIYYILVLDRRGMHLYPIFSPRSPLLGLVFAAVTGWNYAIFSVCNLLLPR